jgi:hypothetical protein
MKFHLTSSAAVFLMVIFYSGQLWAEPEIRTAAGPDNSAWTLAAAGDAVITRRIAQFDHDGDPGFRNLVRLIRGADAAFVNLELSLFRLSSFKGWPEVENGGNWEAGPPGATFGVFRHHDNI